MYAFSLLLLARPSVDKRLGLTVLYVSHFTPGIGVLLILISEVRVFSSCTFLKGVVLPLKK